MNGSIHIVFADWGIPSPSFGPAYVDDDGDLEFLLVFTKWDVVSMLPPVAGL